MVVDIVCIHNSEGITQFRLMLPIDYIILHKVQSKALRKDLCKKDITEN